MLTYFMKDLLLFWRDRKEVLIVIVLPLILVVVLSISMSGLFNDNPMKNLDLTLGVVNEDHQEDAIKAFEVLIRESQTVSQELKQQIIWQVQETPPIELFMNYLTHPDLESWITVQMFSSRSEATESVDNGELNAVLIIPEHYTLQLLSQIYLDQATEPKLSFLAKDTAFEVELVQDVVQSFVDQMNLNYALSTSGSEVDFTHVQWPEGTQEIVGNKQTFTFTLQQYFAFSIGALFVLFMASTVASRTIIEKREHTFHRIVLTNTPALHFLFGKTLAAFILSCIQMVLVFVGSHLILGVFEDRSLIFWSGLLFMAILYSLAIAGLSAMLTSIALRLKKPDVVDGILLFFIMTFGIIGGNFVPIYVMPNWLQQIGEWTPNGLTLAALIEWFQFEDFTLLLIPTIVLLLITFVTVVLSITLYPKRGEIS